MSTHATQDAPAKEGGDQKEKKATTIIINARPHEVTTKEISYEEVIGLAYNNSPPTGEFIVITVTYTKGDNGSEGTMLPGDRVKVKSKMVFDVTATDRS